jgi:hypothetical protein
MRHFQALEKRKREKISCGNERAHDILVVVSAEFVSKHDIDADGRLAQDFK